MRARLAALIAGVFFIVLPAAGAGQQPKVLRYAFPIAETGFDPAQVLRAFESIYRERFDVDLSEMRPILSALRTAVVGRRQRPPAGSGSADAG